MTDSETGRTSPLQHGGAQLSSIRNEKPNPKHVAFGHGLTQAHSPIGALANSGNITKKQVIRDPSFNDMKIMTSNAELSIFESQLKLENEKRFRDDLKKFMKQDEQLIVFNSSSPRFQDPATH